MKGGESFLHFSSHLELTMIHSSIDQTGHII